MKINLEKVKKPCFVVLLLSCSITIVFSQTDTAQISFEDSVLVSQEPVADSTTNHPFGKFWSHDPHSVKQAALFSAILPGLGQAYNEKYWKIPIVYAAIGTAGYFAIANSHTFHDLKNTYLLRTDGDSLTSDEYVNVYGTEEYTGALTDDYLLTYIDQWKRYADINVIVLSFIYVLNIVDAVVDAHLYNFDVSDDLSLHVQPFILSKYAYQTLNGNSMNGIGLNLKLSFK